MAISLAICLRKGSKRRHFSIDDEYSGWRTCHWGGGNTSMLKKMPDLAVRGSNDNALVGGFRLWERE